MKHCQRCVMPDTRPHTIFKSDGTCQACLNYEKNKLTNWESRWKKLKSLCKKYKRADGYYDCLIAVSGGKDSHFITYMMKEVMRMNPLLISVADPFPHSLAGINNLNNISESFKCDLLIFNLDVDLFRKVTRIGFEEMGEPLRFIEAAIYTIPFKYAVALNIPLVVFGENAAFTYGTTAEDEYSAKRFVLAGHSAAGEKLNNTIADFWTKKGIPIERMNALVFPSPDDLARVKPEPIFMSYFVPWDDERNFEIAKKYGFRDLHHEWKREGFLEDYGQIDSLAYIVHLWMKYPKFGFARATDIASRWIRKGKISREEAKKLVMENDHRLDQRAMEDFVTFLGYSRREFWEIVEKYWNPQLFEKIDDLWKLRNPVYHDLRKG